MGSIKKVVKGVGVACMGKERFSDLVASFRRAFMPGVDVIDNGASSGATQEINKHQAETGFWEREIYNIVAWFNGEVARHEGVEAPAESDKIWAQNKKDSAILTWHRACSEAKYQADLCCPQNSFIGKMVLDIGAGPISGSTVFGAEKLYCLDPLFHEYLRIGFPLHYYDARFVHAPSEAIPLPDSFFDVVIAVNSIDHVDNIEATAAEIRRVLKPGGLLAIHAHYHRSSPCEPIELNDVSMRDLFGWCQGFRKISESKYKYGFTLSNPGETYALWKNF